MTDKINSFILPENITKLMREQLENSNKTDVEFGFTMCANRYNIIEAKNIKKGIEHGKGQTGIFIEASCPSRFKSIGTYHTHPDAISRGSAGDLLNTCDKKTNCIGGGEDNKIKCYTKKENIDKIDCTKEFTELISLVEKPLRRKYTEILNDNRELIEISKINSKVDKRIAALNKKVREFNKEYKIFDQRLLKLQNKYFNEIELK